jgi:hypothetical protein
VTIEIALYGLKLRGPLNKSLTFGCIRVEITGRSEAEGKRTRRVDI